MKTAATTWDDLGRNKSMIPTINFDRTDENGQDAWEIRADDRPVGEVYVGFDTDEEPAQPYINSISVVEEYRHQGIGKQVVQLLADHYGSLTSDPGGNTTSEAHSMWRSVPGARQITVSPYGKEIQIWKIGGSAISGHKRANGAENLLRLIADRIEAQGGEPFHG